MFIVFLSVYPSGLITIPPHYFATYASRDSTEVEILATIVVLCSYHGQPPEAAFKACFGTIGSRYAMVASLHILPSASVATLLILYDPQAATKQ
jgi:hypothetical protein